MKLNIMIKTALTVGLLAASLSANAASGVLKVSKEVTVDANPVTVWKLVGNFDGLDVWHPVVVKSRLLKGHNNRPGAERLLTLANGGTIEEKLLTHSNKSESYTYEILKSPLPVTHYKSKIKVSKTKDGKSIVSWSSTFDAKKGVSKDDAIKAITGVYEAGLNQVQKDFAQ